VLTIWSLQAQVVQVVVAQLAGLVAAVAQVDFALLLHLQLVHHLQ
jgi:hypothetical protein